MRGLLAGKVAVVTGAAQGIGLAVARAYVAHGASVVVIDVAAEKADAAARDLDREAPGRAIAIALDVTDEAAVAAAARTVVERLGRVDCAVANAGVLLLKHAVEMGLEEWRRVIDVNLTGAFITATAFARAMIDRGDGGRIILTSSLFGVRGGVENAAYSASKFGMIGLAQCLAAELAPHGILVNCVGPGQMDTDMIRKLFRDRAAIRGIPEADVRAALEGRIPVGHLGALDHLAGTYVYLASDLSRYVTGQTIVVDGGWQLG
jgi:NAD(P)-dependent dehydrogenase (short-subunit alcohol dehydrogenase family)